MRGQARWLDAARWWPDDHGVTTIVSRTQLEASLAELRASVADPREGILGPRSLTWRLGGDVGVFLGGGRAALLQLAHPMVAYAIDHHSRTRADVVGRFQRTFKHVFAMLFGDLDDALTAARRVHAIHTRVHGVLPEAIGAWPAGTRYHANDADALRWVHATLADTTILVREHLDGALPTTIKDRYVLELNRFAALFGIPRVLLPASWEAHAAYMSAMLAGDRLAVTPAAREMGQFLFGRDARVQPPLGRVAEALSAELLPARLAQAFGLRGAPATVRGGLAAFAFVYGRLPRALVALPACVEANNRLAGRGPSAMASWVERQLFGLANRATGAAPR